MTALASILWRLAPANPILLRVVTAGGKRLRHAFTRWTYLALLIGVLLIAMAAATELGSKQSLSAVAKAGAGVFALISYVQLGMICLLAPVFTAGAITQERDSQTYNILLATPLSNAQIVCGILLSRMYYIIALLLSGVPVFAVTLFYGGVTGQNIALSFSIALSTALFMGSLALTIAVFRLGTGKTVFWFYVFNAVYLVGLWFVDAMFLSPRGSGVTSSTTWLTGVHPFLALESVVSPTRYQAPTTTAVAGYLGMVRFYLCHPAYAYVALTLSASLLMVAPSAIVLRRIAQRSDIGLFQYLRHLLFPRLENKTRKARRVWSNPVAWREAATRAGASGRGLTRYLTILIGLTAAATLLYSYHTGMLKASDARLALVGLVIVEFSVALLVATNTSASAVTKERESATLDLLLVTPITSRYYIWGKLRGLVSFMLPFVAVPTLTILFVVIYDAVRGNTFKDPLVFPEVVVLLPVFLTALIAGACMLGLQLSLKWSRTIVAVMASVGILAGISSLLGVCGWVSLRIPVLGLVFNSLSPFYGICALLDPMDFAQTSFPPPPAPGTSGGPGDVDPMLARAVMFVSYFASSGVYCVIVWVMYRSMVKNFDMIIRRQHQ